MDRDRMVKLYTDYIAVNNLSIKDIREKYKCEPWAILHRLSTGYPNNVLLRLSGEIPEMLEFVEYKDCEVCGKTFAPTKSSIKFCSRDCANKQHLNLQAGYNRVKKPKPKKIAKISKIERMARREGKSYGQYVAEKRI